MSEDEHTDTGFYEHKVVLVVMAMKCHAGKR
jgi:hypothetical protein